MDRGSRAGAEKRHEEAERIRRGEVSRALRKMDLSPEGETAVEGLPRSLVGRLLRGPISGTLARAGATAVRNGTASAPDTARADGDRQEEECRALLGLIREVGSPTLSRRYDRGQTVYREGDPACALYVLTEGMVKRCRDHHSEGKEAVLRLLGAWDFFGDAVLGRRTAHMSRAEAVTPCEVVKVPVAFVERTARERPEAAPGLARLLGLELARHKEWIDCVLPRKAEARLANLLGPLAHRFGERTGEGTVVLPRLTHEELAQITASSRESVSVTVNDLRRRGLLRSDGAASCFPNPRQTRPPRRSRAVGEVPRVRSAHAREQESVPEEQGDQALCSNLLVYYQKVLDHLAREGHPLRDEDVAHLWPTRHAHINPYGKYTIDVDGDPEDVTTGGPGLRPLRMS